LVLRGYGFFLRERDGIFEQYSAVFNGNSTADDFTERWGWYSLILTLAGEDILKMNDITKLPIKQIFTHLAYSMDKKGTEQSDL